MPLKIVTLVSLTSIVSFLLVKVGNRKWTLTISISWFEDFWIGATCYRGAPSRQSAGPPHLSWNVTKPGIGIVVVVECVAAIFALVDVCSSIGVAFTISDLLRSRRR